MLNQRMLKNERKNRRKAYWITTCFYLALIGGVYAYGNGTSTNVTQYLPEKVKEWLKIEDQPEQQLKKVKKPRA